MIIHKTQTHLEMVDGSICCGINLAFNYPTTFLKRSEKIEDVTCKRCLKRFYGVGVTKKWRE